MLPLAEMGGTRNKAVVLWLLSREVWMRMNQIVLKAWGSQVGLGFLCLSP